MARERQRLHQHWQQQLERARYEAERAARQYQAVEPENRLVARELERRWEEALAEQAPAGRRSTSASGRSQPASLSAAEQEQIRSLARDIPELWQADTTTAAERQRLMRFLIEQIEVGVQGETERVEVAIRWAGGFVSRHDPGCGPCSVTSSWRTTRGLRARIDELRGGRAVDGRGGGVLERRRASARPSGRRGSPAGWWRAFWRKGEPQRPTARGAVRRGSACRRGSGC